MQSGINNLSHSYRPTSQKKPIEKSSVKFAAVSFVDVSSRVKLLRMISYSLDFYANNFTVKIIAVAASLQDLVMIIT